MTDSLAGIKKCERVCWQMEGKNECHGRRSVCSHLCSGRVFCRGCYCPSVSNAVAKLWWIARRSVVRAWQCALCVDGDCLIPCLFCNKLCTIVCNSSAGAYSREIFFFFSKQTRGMVTRGDNVQERQKREKEWNSNREEEKQRERVRESESSHWLWLIRFS